MGKNTPGVRNQRSVPKRFASPVLDLSDGVERPERQQQQVALVPVLHCELDRGGLVLVDLPAIPPLNLNTPPPFAFPTRQQQTGVKARLDMKHMGEVGPSSGQGDTAGEKIRASGCARSSSLVSLFPWRTNCKTGTARLWGGFWLPG